MNWLKANMDSRGQILVTLLIVIPALALIASAYLTLSSNGYRLERNDQFRTMAQMAADAGADYGVEQINGNPAWTGTNGEATLITDSAKKVTYAVSVTDNSSSSITLTVTGRTYFPASAATPAESVAIKVDLREVTSGSFSVASGEGGLIMKNSSKITGGSVLVNGTINMQNTAQIGLSTSPVESVQVADAVCPVPVDSTYPRICTSSDNQPQPISIANTAKIYGNVQANNQTSTTNMSAPGLTASSGVKTQALPTYNRAAQKAAVTTTINGGYSCSSNTTQTWQANTEIVGNVSLSNKCKIDVKGNIWITGNLSLINSAQLIVDDALGSTQPVIMVDGSGGASFNNSSSLVSNSSNTGFEVITFYSTAACSPDCTSVTGTDLNNSRSKITISLQQSSTGPQSVFYAYWSEVDIANSGQLGALIGQTILLENTGTITFTTSTGLGTSSWVVNGYRRSF
jgi:Tfp pilus assembly protein PilX